jgi:K+-sensing histidine kinase KdpD
MTQLNSQLRLAPSRFLRYGLAVALVAIALGFALLVQRYNVHAPRLIFLFALAVSTWYTGRGPTVVTVVLSIALLDYFSIEPLHTLYYQVQDAGAAAV